jgi:AIG2-like family
MRAYFAYGSNMIVDAMSKRCPEARLGGIAFLRHYRFRIVRSGYASIIPEQGAQVYGILWSVSARDERRLDAYEEVTSGLYRRAHLAVERLASDSDASERIAALVYLANDSATGRPRRGYLAPIMAAARAHRLPEAALADIERCLP